MTPEGVEEGEVVEDRVVVAIEEEELVEVIVVEGVVVEGVVVEEEDDPGG